jgi:hypothetical protein
VGVVQWQVNEQWIGALMCLDYFHDFSAVQVARVRAIFAMRRSMVAPQVHQAALHLREMILPATEKAKVAVETAHRKCSGHGKRVLELSQRASAQRARAIFRLLFLSCARTRG